MGGVPNCHRPKINKEFVMTEEEKLMKKMKEMKQKMRKLWSKMMGNEENEEEREPKKIKWRDTYL